MSRSDSAQEAMGRNERRKQRVELQARLCRHIAQNLACPETPYPFIDDLERPDLFEALSPLFPAFWPALRPADQQRISRERQDTLKAVYELNGQRNEALKGQIISVARALNEIDIVPLLMKGACHLVDNTWPNCSARFIGDIDFLISPDRVQNAWVHLSKHFGLSWGPEEFDRSPALKHLTPLWSDDWQAPVELHRYVLGGYWSRCMPTDDVFLRSRCMSWEGVRIRLPADSDRICMSVLHSAGESRYYVPSVSSRDLLDIRFSCLAWPGEECWSAARHQLVKCGAEAVWEICRSNLQRFAGFDLPAASAPSSPDVRLDTLRWQWQLETGKATSLTSLYGRVAWVWYHLVSPGEPRAYLRRCVADPTVYWHARHRQGAGGEVQSQIQECDVDDADLGSA
ncbi:nucleotidyltransferase family protein [Pseudoruegeria sp. HB172150]|uniref:nucleotidyltransferase family protein n=1 Tax=Pseudoruegeria sp. HB172150 TaxID=2721164 RepID=UPI0015575CC7|nr:nucleotidyltransferase family protein [Pseudoruegeria sp. HB172150]